MDTEIILTAVAFLFIAMAVFGILGRGNRKQEKHLLNMLKQAAASRQSVIKDYDTWNDAAIGLDPATNNLFVVTMMNNQLSSVHIDLTQVKDCQVMRTNKTIVAANDTYPAVEKICLVFIPQEKQQPDTVINFYVAGSDYQPLNGELQLAKKWHGLVRNKIQTL
ncbi:MAG: hypothetical protein WBP16_05790 [Ferruginibacter sp.]